MAVLELTNLGHTAALAAEPYGYLADITDFRVDSNSMPGELGNTWGVEVYQGPVNDYDLAGGNTIVMTCVVPPEIPAVEIDSICLYLNDGTMFAQGFFDNSKIKRHNTSLYLYAYFNAPDVFDDVEIKVKVPYTVPQLENYTDLPPPSVSKITEAIVNHGHCGDSSKLPEYFPTMVVLGSALPKTPLYPPHEPWLDQHTGILPPGEYNYRITAYNANGETVPSRFHSINLVSLNPPELTAKQAAGALNTGTYDYYVTALTLGDGETTVSNVASLSVTKLAEPNAPVLVEEIGGLNAGTYEYAVSALSANGSTLPSPFVSITVNDDAEVEISWTAIPNAIGYQVWGRDPGDAGLLFTVDAATLIAKDNGNTSPDLDTEVPVVAKDAGVKLSWTKILGAFKYRIYGRADGGPSGLIGEVAWNILEFIDDGIQLPGVTPPVVNTTNTGILLKWEEVPDADGYRIYGRDLIGDGLIATVASPTVEYVDDGTIVPGVIPPASNTTTEFEWQLVDGTLLYRGVLTGITNTQFNPPITIDKHDLAFVSVISGVGAGQSRHVRYDGSKIVLLDEPWVINPNGSSIVTLWSGSGCCGGVCTVPDRIKEQTFIPKPPPIIVQGGLGVHFCGVLLGGEPEASSKTNTSSNHQYWWTRRPTSNSNSAYSTDLATLIKIHSLEPGFCDGDGKQQLTKPLQNPLVTPRGNRLPAGRYSSMEDTILVAIRYTWDTILIPEGTRLLLFSRANFSGDILLDQTGPYYLANHIWIGDDRYLWAMKDTVWTGDIGLMFPAETRNWTDGKNMHFWRRGSCIIEQV